MDNTIINLTLMQLFFAFLIPLVIMLISKANHLGKEKDILRISIKMTVQLFILGYVLLFLLRTLPPYIGVFYVFLMLFFASKTLKNRLKHLNKIFIRNGSISMGIGSLFLLAYFIVIIVSPKPLLNPQYIIPTYGMILGNTLTAMNLGANALNDNLKSEKRYIFTLINLGVPSDVAVNKVFKKTLAVSISPTLTSMSAIGLVSLPGMMTGQILSGTDPIISVKYQMAIMFGIFGSVFISNLIFLYLSKKTIINKYGQIQTNYIV